MAIAEAFAPAKINLTLHVTGQRADGYHLLDSLVVFADVGDWLTVEEAAGLSLTVTGPMAAGVPADGTNSVLRAATFLGQDGLAFTLDKRLPAAAGIGGGTSDAAAALNAMARARGVPVPSDLLPLGADVPVCAFGRAVRMSGVGERLDPIEGLPQLPAVLVNPGVPVSTPAIFGALARKDNPPMPQPIPRFSGVSDAAAWLAGQRNDLEPPARKIEPAIGQVMKALAQGAERPLLCRMSGSGATCFALYPTQQATERAAKDLAAAHPDWWVVACMLS